jgi:hypothetical protein
MTRGSRTRSAKPQNYVGREATAGARTTRKSFERKTMSRSFQKTPVAYVWKAHYGAGQKIKRQAAKRRRQSGELQLSGNYSSFQIWGEDLKEGRSWKTNKVIRK